MLINISHLLLQRNQNKGNQEPTLVQMLPTAHVSLQQPSQLHV